MHNRIFHLNEAEGIFFPAFDCKICNDSQMSSNCGKAERMWDGLAFHGGTTFTVTWKGTVELGQYDTFQSFISVAPQGHGTGYAVVDGIRILLFSDLSGGEEPVEWRGKLPKGHFLTEVDLEFSFPTPQNAIQISWLGLANSRMEAVVEARVPVWQEEWCNELVPDRAGEIDKNLVLSSEEGKTFRRLFQENSKLRDVLRRNADEAMQIKVESLVREYVPVAPHMQRFARVRDRGRANPEGKILNLAVAGYLLQEPAYSYQAARMILALLPMKWYEGPVCGMEGSHFHHVCFTEDHLMSEVTLASGFLGGIFKPAVMKQIVEKIEQVWRFVWAKSTEPGYRNYMNQGIVSCRGMMLGAAFLELWKGGFTTYMDNAYQLHCKRIENYLTKDGHCAEGPNYYEYSFSTSILLWHVYSRMTGKIISEILPERFRRSGRYWEAILSASRREGIKIPVNCGALAPASMLLLTYLTIFGDFPEGNNYLTARLSSDQEESGSNFDLLFYEYYRNRVEIQPYCKPFEESICFPEAGFLTWRKGNTKLIVTAERNPLTGHYHEDRGSIVLEADGEMLLPDIGTTSYSNPICLLMDKKEYHNLACPADLPMLAESEIGRTAAAMAGNPIAEELTRKQMDIPEAKVLYSQAKKGEYTFAVDTGMLFGENISGVRRGRMKDHSLLLEDEWIFPENHPLLLTYLSYSPWIVKGEQAVSGRMNLQIRSAGQYKLETEAGMIDFAGKPVYILRIQQEPASHHYIESHIIWDAPSPSPQKNGRENRIAIQALLDRGGLIQMEEPGVYEIEDTLVIRPNTRLICAPGVIWKRSKSSVGSFLLVNQGAFTHQWDENITIEGLTVASNGVEARLNTGVYGLTGELSFFYVKHLRITDFTCLDLPPLSYGIHICTFEDIILERLQIEGRKDAVHLGTGRRFVIRHGLFRTFDDPIALNAHDYAVANPQMGWIEDGLIEDCYDLDDSDTTGYFCRILAGAWVDWYSGMEIQNSDTVVCNGRVYRAFQKPDGIRYRSVTPPTHQKGMKTLDGIHWVMVQENITYQCGCRNIHFRNIHLQKKRETAFSIHFDHDQFSRSVYPGAEMPIQQNLIFENIIVENKVDCLIRSITPIDTIKLIGSSLGEGGVLLESLPEERQEYPMTDMLLHANTLTVMEQPALVDCKKGRSCRVKASCNIVKVPGYRAKLKGMVQVLETDFPVDIEEQVCNPQNT